MPYTPPGNLISPVFSGPVYVAPAGGDLLANFGEAGGGGRVAQIAAQLALSCPVVVGHGVSIGCAATLSVGAALPVSVGTRSELSAVPQLHVAADASSGAGATVVATIPVTAASGVFFGFTVGIDATLELVAAIPVVQTIVSVVDIQLRFHASIHPTVGNSTQASVRLRMVPVFRGTRGNMIRVIARMSSQSNLRCEHGVQASMSGQVALRGNAVAKFTPGVEGGFSVCVSLAGRIFAEQPKPAALPCIYSCQRTHNLTVYSDAI